MSLARGGVGITVTVTARWHDGRPLEGDYASLLFCFKHFVLACTSTFIKSISSSYIYSITSQDCSLECSRLLKAS